MENNENFNNNLDDQTSENNNFEYNDGLGDLLREKEKYLFSWKKTGIFTLLFLGVVGIWLTIILNTGKKIANEDLPTGHPKLSEIESSSTLSENNLDNSKLDDLQQKLVQIEKENLELIGEIDDILEDNVEEDNKIKIARTNFETKNIQRKETKKIKNNVRLAKNKTKKIISENLNSNKKLFKIIVGSFKNLKNAKRFQSELAAKNIKALITSKSINNQLFFRLQAGSFKQKTNANIRISTLKSKGIKGYIIKD